MDKVLLVDAADCLRRKIDAYRVKNYLTLNGYLVVDDATDADFVIISTCGVTNDKIEEAVTAINYAKKYPVDVIVLGCAVTTDPDTLPDSIIAVPINKMHLLDEIFKAHVKYKDVPVPTQSLEEQELVYFPICRGCTEGCSYCATRKAIGYVSSTSLDDCVRLFEKLLKKNPTRMIFDGDNIGAYGVDRKESLSTLLDALPDISRDYLLNLDMLHPFYFLENYNSILERIKKRDIGFLLIPFQSGNPRILKLMNRRGSISEAIEHLKHIRTVDPGVILGTHIIVGFPSETDEEFEDTIAALKEVSFDWVRAFCFSPRNNTKAKNLPQHISPDKLESRLERIISEMKSCGYFAKRNSSGVTFCRKHLIIEKQFESNPYRLVCYREVIAL